MEYIANAVIPGVGGHPNHVLFLTADAFGVLPPIARLNPAQAMYHFLSGYTAKLAGTEAGLGSEPVPEFSTCFASPFIPLAPAVYAKMLGERLQQHNAQCWLVNTGWTGGAFGTGERMSLKYTRAMVNAALDGRLSNVEFVTEPAFGLSIPLSCPDVPAELLNPRNAWKDPRAYDAQAVMLAEKFEKNFAKFEAPAGVREAGPVARKLRTKEKSNTARSLARDGQVLRHAHGSAHTVLQLGSVCSGSTKRRADLLVHWCSACRRENVFHSPVYPSRGLVSVKPDRFSLLRHHHWNPRRNRAPVVEDGHDRAGVGDVVQRIGGQYDQVRALARPQRSARGLDAQQRSVAPGGAYDGLHRSEPRLHHVFQFPMLRESWNAGRHST